MEAASGQCSGPIRWHEGTRIPVWKLVSRWPVAGGYWWIEVSYAAAGITHYDGTYVVALDSRPVPLAINDTSGRLSEFVDSGISMQVNFDRGDEHSCWWRYL